MIIIIKQLLHAGIDNDGICSGLLLYLHKNIFIPYYLSMYVSRTQSVQYETKNLQKDPLKEFSSKNCFQDLRYLSKTQVKVPF